MPHAIFHQVGYTVDVGFDYLYWFLHEEIGAAIAGGMDDVMEGNASVERLFYVTLYEFKNLFWKI